MVWPSGSKRREEIRHDCHSSYDHEPLTTGHGKPRRPHTDTSNGLYYTNTCKVCTNTPNTNSNFSPWHAHLKHTHSCHPQQLQWTHNRSRAMLANINTNTFNAFIQMHNWSSTVCVCIYTYIWIYAQQEMKHSHSVKPTIYKPHTRVASMPGHIHAWKHTHTHLRALKSFCFSLPLKLWNRTQKSQESGQRAAQTLTAALYPPSLHNYTPYLKHCGGHPVSASVCCVVVCVSFSLSLFGFLSLSPAVF